MNLYIHKDKEGNMLCSVNPKIYYSKANKKLTRKLKVTKVKYERI